MMRCLLITTLLLCAASTDSAADQTTVGTSDWQRVDALPAGTKIVVTLKTIEERVGEFRQSTADDVTIAVRRTGTIHLETLPKSAIRTVARYDGILDGIGKGALTGASGFVALLGAATTSSNSGIRNSATCWASMPKSQSLTDSPSCQCSGITRVEIPGRPRRSASVATGASEPPPSPRPVWQDLGHPQIRRVQLVGRCHRLFDDARRRDRGSCVRNSRAHGRSGFVVCIYGRIGQSLRKIKSTGRGTTSADE
jgi:hypothetical protein